MVERNPAPRLDLISDPELVRRVNLTISCTDADALPKVPGAGEVFERDGVTLQRMFNGVLIEEGCYAGHWMTEVIRSLHGHHEPQEEVAFAAIIDRLQRDNIENPRMIEFGSFWSFYSLWFGSALKDAQMFGLEPDPNNLEVGKRNAILNGQENQIEFLHGAIGNEPGEPLLFDNESDGGTTTVIQQDLDSLLTRKNWDKVDLVLVDVQGAEAILLSRARETLKSGRVRFLVVSTHHHAISNDPLTHQKAVQLIEECGGHILAEHTPEESFSGDGLVAASFDPADDDMTVAISYARARDSVFGELEWDLAASLTGSAELLKRAESAEGEIARIHATRLWRMTAPLRRVYRSLRNVTPGHLSRR